MGPKVTQFGYQFCHFVMCFTVQVFGIVYSSVLTLSNFKILQNVIGGKHSYTRKITRVSLKEAAKIIQFKL